MDTITDIVARAQKKITRIGYESKVLILEEQGEIHISIQSCLPMGKAHRNVRDSIRRRFRRSKQLSGYTVYLFLNPTHPGRACNTFVLPANQSNWDRGVQKMLPYEGLVA